MCNTARVFRHLIWHYTISVARCGGRRGGMRPGACKWCVEMCDVVSVFHVCHPRYLLGSHGVELLNVKLLVNMQLTLIMHCQIVTFICYLFHFIIRMYTFALSNWFPIFLICQCFMLLRFPFCPNIFNITKYNKKTKANTCVSTVFCSSHLAELKISLIYRIMLTAFL